MRLRVFSLISILLGALLLAAPLWAQDGEMVLSLRRDWGYGGFNGDIEGTFTLSAEAPVNVAAVTFLIDGQSVGTDDEAPFRLQFQTGAFPLGRHELSATGVTAGGEALTSNTIVRNFVTAGAGWASGLRIAVPVVLLALLAMLFGVVAETRSSKKRTGYKGRWGTAICPKCSQPFARHLFAPNLATRKFDRCPHCGKWSVVGVARADELAAFEAAASQEHTSPLPPANPEERRRQQLEDSRFEDI